MSGVSPVGIAENGTRSGKVSFDLLFMRLVVPNLLPCLPSLAEGLVPAGQHYYEGSESSAERIIGLHVAEASLLISIELLSIPSPTTLLPFRSPQFDTLPGSVTVRAVSPTVRSERTDLGSSLGRCVRSGVRESLGRSPTGLAESSSLSLRTAHSPLVASHPFC
jgi:hypothetical protein